MSSEQFFLILSTIYLVPGMGEGARKVFGWAFLLLAIYFMFTS